MYYFFFSYSRSDNNEYLRTFYSDLDEAVRGIVGGGDVSFFDQSGNEPGDVWEENLETALANSRVFVAVVTASYCKKPYCGKEWAAFQERVARYTQGVNLDQPAPLAIPVLWIPPDERVAPFPREIKSRHFHVGDPGSIPNRKGVAYLTRLKGEFKREYLDLINTLAERIVSLAVEHESIDRYATVAKLATLESPFLAPGLAAPGAARPGLKQSGGPRHVHFVYGAATPEEVQHSGRGALNGYGESGGAEWQPFFPDDRTIGAVAPQVASSDEIGMISHEMPLSPDLDVQVRRCEEKRQLVVVLLDAWTAKLKSYGDILRKLDQQNYINCSVLIPWNEGDPDTAKTGEHLKEAVRNTLYHRFKNAGDLFLRHEIRGVPELREQLADVLVRLRAEVINRTHPEAAVLPPGGARPSISGPGGQHG
jgi:FxsC-like protein